MSDNTLFLRLAAPMQSWGTSSRFQLRRTDAHPSKLGVLGLLLCAMGVGRRDSAQALEKLRPLVMGIRVDHPGKLDWDYHTAGAGIGIRSADGKIKSTASTMEYETLLSRRQYLCDASFLVALQGGAGTISDCVRALEDPVWPIFLGRKCCVPSETVFAGTGSFATLSEALSSLPWQARPHGAVGFGGSANRELEIFVECPAGSAPPEHAQLAYDAPRSFGYWNYGARWVVNGTVTVAVGKPPQLSSNSFGRRDPYGSDWSALRSGRLERDNYLCVFCKSPAVDVHHLDYGDVRLDTLRSVCKICHDACTMLEYGNDMHQQRVDPSDPSQRPALRRQIGQLVADRRLGRRRHLLEVGRLTPGDYFDELPESWDTRDH